MKKYADKEIKEVFKMLGLPTDNEIRLLNRSEPQMQTNHRIIISAGTSSKFVYRE